MLSVVQVFAATQRYRLWFCEIITKSEFFFLLQARLNVNSRFAALNPEKNKNKNKNVAFPSHAFTILDFSGGIF